MPTAKAYGPLAGTGGPGAPSRPRISDTLTRRGAGAPVSPESAAATSQRKAAPISAEKPESEIFRTASTVTPLPVKDTLGVDEELGDTGLPDGDTEGDCVGDGVYDGVYVGVKEGDAPLLRVAVLDADGVGVVVLVPDSVVTSEFDTEELAPTDSVGVEDGLGDFV